MMRIQKISIMLLSCLFPCIRWVQGYTNGTFKFIDMKTACYTCGNFIVFLNVETKTRKTLQSPGSGIGAFTASGHRRCLAFSDLRLNPSIFVYNYPELELMCELKGESFLVAPRLHLKQQANKADFSCYQTVLRGNTKYRKHVKIIPLLFFRYN